MKFELNENIYTLKYNLSSRIKLSEIFETEEDMLQLIQEQDFESLILFVLHCIQENITEEKFLSSFPRVLETRQGFFEMAIKTIKEAVNPFDIDTPNKDSKGVRKSVKTDYRALILEVMSKGFTQKEVLNMTTWDINLIFEADYRKLERETIHTNALVNTMIGLMGGKEKFDLLGREVKTEDLEEKYSTEIEALDLLNKIKGE